MPEKSFTNRLASEKSPYLLQHAHNPVDWYAWGEEAFAKALAEDKPVFLSVGYSTCHWCHVMETESFENEEIAKILNQYFVSIKVDREERPDVDGLYMQAVMAIAGSGGWPMSVFLTPEREPFYGGTYFPPQDQWGRPGFMTLLLTIHDKWMNERAQITTASKQITSVLQNSVEAKSGECKKLDEHVLDNAYQQYLMSFDEQCAGFGQAPKFPSSHNLSFLLNYWKRTGEAKALDMAEKTLQHMAFGGMFDHLGGGFHRYSTDQKWHVPHFEKMLYDQAMLVRTYTEAFQATGKEIYAQIVRSVLDYVLRDMTHEQGGFFSAEDADSAADSANPKEKSEGAFYVFTRKEVEDVLGAERGAEWCEIFGIREEGNAEQDPMNEFTGKNIFTMTARIKEDEGQDKRPTQFMPEGLDESRQKLLEYRMRRLRPHLDDKVLTDWNGLMIASLAFAGRVLGEERYLDASKKAADFLIGKMMDSKGRLLHRWRDDDVAIGGFLDDYAFLCMGLFELYEAVFDPRYLKHCIQLLERMIAQFWDNERGGFYFSSAECKDLISRKKDVYDGAIPSGNSVATLMLLKAGRALMNKGFEDTGSQNLAYFSDQIAKFPSGYPQMLIGLSFMLGPTHEIVIAAEKDDAFYSDCIREINANFLPNKVVLLNSSGTDSEAILRQIAPFLQEKKKIKNEAAAYICQNFTCGQPVKEASVLRKILKE